MYLRRAFRLFAFSVVGLVVVAAMSGCNAALKGTAPSAAEGFAMHGSVHGGQQAVVGSRVYLYAANATNGYASSAHSLLNVAKAGVLTDGSGKGYVLSGANGAFNIGGDWVCTNGTDQLYLLALGGTRDWRLERIMMHSP